jgi:soluble lytic murein transglycosylase-like protein
MKALITLICAVLPLTLYAADDLDKCFDSAAALYSLDKRILVSIASVESKLNPYAMNVKGDSRHYKTADDALIALSSLDKSGNFDLGIMQINSSWFRRYKIDFSMAFNPCYNVHFGAYVLAGELYAAKGDINLAIGRYHSPKQDRQDKYRIKVVREFRKLYE